MATDVDAVDPAAARAHLLSEHRDTIETVLECADAVAAGWDDGATSDPDAVRRPLRAALDRAGVLERLSALLATAVRAGGAEFRSRPVAAPPYVVVTSRGPVLRATLDGCRLVVTIRTFDVERAPVRYVRGATAVEPALDVTVT